MLFTRKWRFPMLNKTFVITELGEPFSWTQKYIDHVQHLKKDGWSWKIFTPNKYDVPEGGNVEVVPMTAEEFADLVEKKLTIRPQMYITDKGVPSVHVTDFYVFTGLIFEDYLLDTDYWGITNMDIVYGNLSKFLSDQELMKYDIWTDDVKNGKGVVNGIFSLWKNHHHVNTLCYRIPSWGAKIAQDPCPKCAGSGLHHHLYGTDEIDMVPILQKLADEGAIKYGHPQYYPLHSYDRLEQHVPDIKLEIKDDGSLWERFRDTDPHGDSDRAGREIAYFHFIRSKEWPKSL